MVSKGHVVRYLASKIDMQTLRSIVKFNVEIDRQLYDVTGLV